MTLTTARVGTNNRSQIVTIPLAFRFPETIKQSIYAKLATTWCCLHGQTIGRIF